MITFTLDKDCILISGNKMPAGAFTQFRYHAQQLRLVWDPNRKCWKAPAYKYQDVKNVFEDIDTIEDKVDPVKLAALSEGKPVQFAEAQRRIPDYSLLNYPPMKGKVPNENFQHVGIMKGINKSCYYFAWGCGSGKSYVASAIIAERLLKYRDCTKVLFVTSTIGVKNLYFELLKFIKGLDESRVTIADKNNRTPFRDDVDIIITSYGSYRLICNEYKKLAKVKAKNPRKPYLPIEKWSDGKAMLILDEAHNIANPTSQQTQMMLLHAPLFKYRYLFSGTPADKFEKLYAQYQVLDPYLNYNLSYNAWKDKLAVLGDHFSAYAIKEWKRDELEKLNKRFTGSYGNYYNTSDVVELPDHYEKRVYCAMNPKHRELYQAFVQEDLANLKGFSTRDIVNRFPYQMLSLDCPKLLLNHEEKLSSRLYKAIEGFKDDYLSKLEYTDAILEEETAPTEKGILWALHPATLDILYKRYQKYNPILINADIEQSERFALVDEFKKGDHRLLIASISCLNTSVTITECSFQVYLERGFSYSTFEQSQRRIYRAGQDKTVTSYYLIYERSLDSLVDANLSSKGQIVEGAVSKDFLTKEQWQRIFNGSVNDTFEDLK